MYVWLCTCVALRLMCCMLFDALSIVGCISCDKSVLHVVVLFVVLMLLLYVCSVVLMSLLMLLLC